MVKREPRLFLHLILYIETIGKLRKNLGSWDSMSNDGNKSSK